MGAGSQEASSAALVTVMRSLKRLSGTHASVIIASRSGYLGGKIERQEKTEQDRTVMSRAGEGRVEAIREGMYGEEK